MPAGDIPARQPSQEPGEEKTVLDSAVKAPNGTMPPYEIEINNGLEAWPGGKKDSPLANASMGHAEASSKPFRCLPTDEATASKLCS